MRSLGPAAAGAGPHQTRDLSIVPKAHFRAQFGVVAFGCSRRPVKLNDSTVHACGPCCTSSGSAAALGGSSKAYFVRSKTLKGSQIQSRCSSSRRRKFVPPSASVEESSEVGKLAPLPRGTDEIVEQATKACLRAWADGVSRQSVELLLPLIGATDLDDWPGGIRQQFKAASPLLEKMLLQLKQQDELQGPLSASILDEGDAVAAWQSPSLAAVLFPTAETLRQVQDIAEARKTGLVLMVNPQWQAGQAISDFGFGPWKRRKEEFVATFKEVFVMKQFRIFGDNVRLLLAYPGKWQVFVAQNDGTSECIAVRESKPSYKELEELLKGTAGTSASKTWIERVKSEFEFNRDTLKLGE